MMIYNSTVAIEANVIRFVFKCVELTDVHVSNQTFSVLHY